MLILKKNKKLVTMLLILLITLVVKNLYSAIREKNLEGIETFNDREGIFLIEDDTPEEKFIPTFENIHKITSMGQKKKYLYTIDTTAYVLEEDLDINLFVNANLKSNLRGGEPKVLIFHTHSQEYFIDSTENLEESSIVGVGRKLASILVEEYNIPVVHDVGQYDVVDGILQRGTSYETMEPAVTRILKKYPSIEVIIDLHRDGIPDNIHLVTEINGKPTAKIMFFNGITRLNNNGEPEELETLYNPYLKDNLALSLQLQLISNELYPGFARNIYIKPYRYSLHMLPKSMLVEVGANTNTLEEAINAMEPLAEIIVKVLQE